MERKVDCLENILLCQFVENIVATVILIGWRCFAVTWGMNGENHQLMQFSSERFSCTSILSLFHFYGTNWINPDSLEGRYPILILFETHKIHTVHTLSAYWVILKYYHIYKLKVHLISFQVNVFRPCSSGFLSFIFISISILDVRINFLIVVN